jgi:hypothetical protein
MRGEASRLLRGEVCPLPGDGAQLERGARLLEARRARIHAREERDARAVSDREVRETSSRRRDARGGRNRDVVAEEADEGPPGPGPRVRNGAAGEPKRERGEIATDVLRRENVVSRGKQDPPRGRSRPGGRILVART